MHFEREITPGVTIADQPTRADLETLKAAGYVGVVNLRQDGEPEQPIGVADEGRMATELGLAYHHLGVGSPGLDPGQVAAFCDFVDQQAANGGKVLVHCRKGGRAAALVLVQQARAQGWSADEAAAKGLAIGLEVDGGLRTLAETQIRNSARSS